MMLTINFSLLKANIKDIQDFSTLLQNSLEYFDEEKYDLSLPDTSNISRVAKAINLIRQYEFSLTHYSKTLFELLDYALLRDENHQLLITKETVNDFVRANFIPSSYLVELNNQLITLASTLSRQFQQNKEEVFFTETTAAIQKYFEENDNLLSFFMNNNLSGSALPSKEMAEYFERFKTLYRFNGFYGTLDDELLCYLSLIYALLQCTMHISYAIAMQTVHE